MRSPVDYYRSVSAKWERNPAGGLGKRFRALGKQSGGLLAQTATFTAATPVEHSNVSKTIPCEKAGAS
jgi:hypothetical protein